MKRASAYGIEEARRELPVLVERARVGETIIVTRRGQPCAALVPLSAIPRKAGVSFATLRGSGEGFWGPDPARLVAALREEW